MIQQRTLGRIHRALGWAMLLMLPAQLLTGLWAEGRFGGDGAKAASLHIGPWLVLPLGIMIFSHGLLGIRLTVMKRMGNRPGGIFLTAVWAALVAMLVILVV